MRYKELVSGKNNGGKERGWIREETGDIYSVHCIMAEWFCTYSQTLLYSTRHNEPMQQ